MARHIPVRCLVSAGPTREFFDPVRFLSNPSSGKMGYALAAAAARRGWLVELVSGPVSLTPPPGVTVIPVVTGAEMLEAVAARFAACDLLIMTAAVMDYRPVRREDRKIKKSSGLLSIDLEPVTDILKTVASGKTHQTVVGFAAETDHLEEYAQRKLIGKNCDYIVANRVGGPDGAFESDTNAVIILGREGRRQELGPAPKTLLAEDLMAVFARHLETAASNAPATGCGGLNPG